MVPRGRELVDAAYGLAVQVEGEAVQVLAVEVLSGTPAPPHR